MFHNDTEKGSEKMTAFAYLFTFLKNAIYGTTNFFTKDLNGNSLDAIYILALRFLLSFAILWILKTRKSAHHYGKMSYPFVYQQLSGRLGSCSK